MTTLPVLGEKFWLRIIYIFSAVLAFAVAFLILGPRPDGMEAAVDVSGLPTINAILNLTTTVLLVVAYVFIRQKKISLHKNTMLTAFGTSALFLVTYVIYHWFKSGQFQDSHWQQANHPELAMRQGWHLLTCSKWSSFSVAYKRLNREKV